MNIDLKRLCRRLGYEFQSLDRLTLALTHRSVSGKKNNERLEFLGDSILNFIIAEALYEKFPEAKEGELSRLRAHLVQGKTLAEIAKEMELGDYIRLGTGELKSGGHRRASILADAVEAIIGAIYQESGMDPTRDIVLAWYQSRLAQVTLENTGKDAKTRLQEFLQSRQQTLPNYEVIDIKGNAHNQSFTVMCEVQSKESATPGNEQAQAEEKLQIQGVGSSRRKAEQAAASAMLVALGVDNHES